jgi:undecaprenyl diphosphate synthase
MIIPSHIAIIMDGNGRWGIKNFNSRSIGHKYGVKKLKSIIQFSISKKIKCLTLYALSYDNLKKRNKKEIKNLFIIFEEYINQNLDYFIKKKISLNFFGETNGLSNKIKSLIKKTQKLTFSKNCVANINIALNYSSKKELIYSIKRLIKKKKIINEKNIEDNLYSSGFNSPEILIRTGGYKRLSDFLLWQLSYTELFFFDKMWPDFNTRDLNKVLIDYNKILRKFGS